MHVASPQDSLDAGQKIRERLNAGDATGAVEFAEQLSGEPALVDQLRAFTWAEVGRPLGNPDIIRRAIEVWETTGTDNPGTAYNVANSEQDLWEMSVGELGYRSALEQRRHHLHRARALYGQVGDDDAAPVELRVQALTNLGNSYDHMGRDVDALVAYDRALEVDPNFAMALGNKGVALLGIAPHMHGHEHAVLAPAAAALDAALADEEGLIEIGGPGSVDYFKEQRARIQGGRARSRTPSAPDWADPYLSWCRDNGLFLHISQACITPELNRLDPLFFASIFSDKTTEGERRVLHVIEGFNAAKQEYLTARYLIWLATSGDSPVRDHAAEVGARSGFLDTYRDTRWGIRTGVSIQAFTSAVNVLDKVAGLTHMYFDTGRVRDVYFRLLWHRNAQRNKPVEMDPAFVPHLAKNEYFNRGLLALCDLSCDIEQVTPLNDFVERRHTATHRFLVAHDAFAADLPPNDDWVEHVRWDEVAAGGIDLLRIGRAALIYLARTIDVIERRADQERSVSGKVTLPMPLSPALPELDY